MLLPLLSVALLALAAAAVAPPTHSYTFHSKERPPAGAFIVDEGIPGDSLAYVVDRCAVCVLYVGVWSVAVAGARRSGSGSGSGSGRGRETYMDVGCVVRGLCG